MKTSKPLWLSTGLSCWILTIVYSACDAAPALTPVEDSKAKAVVVIPTNTSKSATDVEALAGTDEYGRYLSAVREFADNVLEHGRDKFGPKHTPLFVDGINVDTLEPVKLKCGANTWIISNLASQQNLLRTLDGLSKLTGDEKYRTAAIEAIRYAFANLVDRNGLLYWGGQACYDAGTETVVPPLDSQDRFNKPIHEIKCQYPYYPLMWEADHGATEQFIEAFWNAHIIDWRNLDMNRVASFNKRRWMRSFWTREYSNGKVFFVGRGLTFANAGSELVYAAAMLSKLRNFEGPLVWAKRLAHRYVESRDPKTGIGAYMYSQVERDRGKAQFGPELGDDVLEGKILQVGLAEDRIAKMGICQIKLAELLGERGKEFQQWALEDMKAYAKHAYIPQDNTLISIVTDGTDLSHFELKRDGYFGKKGESLKIRPADCEWLWAYALAYRVSGDEFMWKMVRDIARGNGLGDIGSSPKGPHKLNLSTECSWPEAIFSLIELFRKTGKNDFLVLARKIGDNILANKFQKGFFSRSTDRVFAQFGRIEPLALLHLVAVGRSKQDTVPCAWPAGGYFRAYVGQKAIYDGTIYNTRRVKERSVSTRPAYPHKTK